MVKKKVVKKRSSQNSQSIKKNSSRKISQGLAIGALLINIIIPGLGSLIAHKVKVGIWQIILLFIGIFLSYFTYLGIPFLVVAWIWGLITGIQLINQSE